MYTSCVERKKKILHTTPTSSLQAKKKPSGHRQRESTKIESLRKKLSPQSENRAQPRLSLEGNQPSLAAIYVIYYTRKLSACSRLGSGVYTPIASEEADDNALSLGLCTRRYTSSCVYRGISRAHDLTSIDHLGIYHRRRSYC